MYAFGVAYMGDYARVLVGSIGVGALGGDVGDRFAVLPLIAGDHVDRLLEKVEVKVLIAKRRRKVKIAVNKCL